jgi:hypothetical protein
MNHWDAESLLILLDPSSLYRSPQEFREEIINPSPVPDTRL